MSAYLSSFLNTTTTKYNSIRRALISSDTDGDTEDESHISRALRNYYTEKGRPFPDWLPPDPNAPPVPQPVSFNAAAGRGYGNQQQQQPQQSQRWGRGGGGLSDLWGDGSDQQQQQPMEPQGNSLRPNRFGQGPAPQRAGAVAGGAAVAGGGGRFGDLYGDQGRPQSGGRAAGSFQNSRMQDNASPAPSTGSGNTAKDMLKQKLWGGGRTASPTPGGNTGGSYGSGGGNPYDAPSSRPQYGGGQSSYGGNDSYGGGGGRSNQGSSWGGNDAPAAAPARGYGSNPYGNQAGGGRMGLPSGPRPKRN